MQPAPDGLTNSRVEASSNMVWQRRYFIVLTILGLLAIAGVIIWGIGLVAQPVILFIISAVFAYILYPLVKLFQRVMPRLAAILLAMLLVLAIVAFVFLYVMIASLQQLALLVKSLQAYFQHLGQQGRPQWLTELAQTLGIGQGQLHVSGQQLVAYLSNAINGVLPLIGNIFSLFVIGLIVASLSVYLMIDGPRIDGWLRRNAPLRYRAHVNFFLDTVERTMGGFVRGAVYMGVLITAIVGVGGLHHWGSLSRLTAGDRVHLRVHPASRLLDFRLHWHSLCPHSGMADSTHLRDLCLAGPGRARWADSGPACLWPGSGTASYGLVTGAAGRRPAFWNDWRSAGLSRGGDHPDLHHLPVENLAREPCQ